MFHCTRLVLNWTVRGYFISGCLPFLSPVLSRFHHEYGAIATNSKPNQFSTSSSGYIFIEEEENKRSNKKQEFSVIQNGNDKIKKRRVMCTEIIQREPLSSTEKDTLEKWKVILSQSTHHNEAIFVLGPMCSGKTKTISDFKNTDIFRKFAYIDTDEIMEGLDGYDKAKINQFYPKARRVVIHLTDWLLEERISFIAEGTCVKYDELVDYIIRLKEKGYKIKVKKIDQVPLETVLDRAKKRVTRPVSSEVIKDIYFNSNKGIKRLWEVNKNGYLFEEFITV